MGRDAKKIPCGEPTCMCGGIDDDIVSADAAPWLVCLHPGDRVQTPAPTASPMPMCSAATLVNPGQSPTAQACQAACKAHGGSKCRYAYAQLFTPIAPSQGQACGFSCRGKHYTTDVKVSSVICDNLKIAYCGRRTPGLSAWAIILIVLIVMMFLVFGLIVRKWYLQTKSRTGLHHAGKKS